MDSDNEDSHVNEMTNIVYVCGLIIDIEAITKQQILKLRKMMPKKDYRYVFNTN